MFNRYKIVWLSGLGAGLEFFDFTIYLLFATYLKQVFFPNTNSWVGWLAIFATFAVGYIARPLGGCFFGHMGDKYGRKQSLVKAILIMATATLLVGLLPSYQQIGVLSPIALVVLRIVQGFSVGGEIPGTTIFTMEHFSQRHTGLLVGCIFMSITLGNSLAGLIAYLLNHLLDHQAMLSWGWRVPFFIGFVLAGVSYFLRKSTLETPDFMSMYEHNRIVTLPLKILLQRHWQQLLVGVGLAALIAASISTLLYMPVYMIQMLHYPNNQVYAVITVSFTVLGVLVPLFGWLSDTVGRRTLIIMGSLLMVIIGGGLFSGLIHHIAMMPWLFGLVLVIIAASVNGCYALAIAEQFPAYIRCSGMGVSYNLAFVIFGGLMPVVVTLLWKLTDSLYVPYYFLILSALITLLAGLYWRRHNGDVIA